MSLLYTYYGDDFTGSTDVLEQLASHGVPAVLFLVPPTPTDLAAFPNVRAIGIAGESRSRSPQWMSTHLPPVFHQLAGLGAPVLHYKVCSTFDSSPQHGSIGRAIELAFDHLHPRFVPIVVGAPHLRRFVSEGHLFASAPDGAIHRIDRHPMSRHPVTPMRDSDLRRHLARQTTLPIGHIDHRQLTSHSAAQQALNSQLQAGNRILLFDTISSAELHRTGHLLWQEATHNQKANTTTLFSASSSGLTAALLHAWREQHLIDHQPTPSAVTPAAPLLVLSGSCSVATERQIRWALAHNFHGIPLDPANLMESDAIEAATQSLSSGRDTILYTALGPPSSPAQDHSLSTTLGHILRELLHRTTIRRVLLCGGDTSSHAVQQLGLTALTWLTNLQPGAPLCQAHGSALQRPLELVLKGGQIGSDDFFAVVRSGSSPPPP